MNPSTAFATVLADELARCGLREVVVAPGSRSTPLAMAFWDLDRAGQVRLHVRIDERSASFTALGLAKASGRPAAVVCTSGTAAANFHPAVIEADESAVPLLVLTADRPPELRGTGASQTVDQVKLYGDAVRWYAEAGVPERRPGLAGYWRSLACRAWAHAAGETGTLPGPVHLNLPLRDPLVPGTGASAGDAPGHDAPGHDAPGHDAPGHDVPGHDVRDTKPAATADPAPPGWPESLDGRAGGAPWTRFGPPSAAGQFPGAVLELPWAERGLVVCGDGDYDATALVELAERAGWPVLAEPSSGARRGGNALTSYQYLLASPEFMAAHRPEVIVSAGRPGLSRPQSALLRLARDGHPGDAAPRDDGKQAASGTAGVRHVIITRGPGRWADPQRAATDVATAVTLAGVPDPVGLVPADPISGAPAARPAPGRWLDDWRRADAAATRAAARPPRSPLTMRSSSPDTSSPDAPAAKSQRSPESRHSPESPELLTEPEVARELIAALPERALLWCGNSLSVRDIDLLMPPRTDIRVLASRGASGIDGTFSTAAGAALAHAADHPGALTFALIGDLSLLHDAPGLVIGPGEPRPDLCVVVVNNDGGGIFEELEPAAFRPGPFERLFGTPHGASLAALAAAFGVPYTAAARPGEVAAAVAATTPGSGPRIVEVRTGRAANAGLRARMLDAALHAVKLRCVTEDNHAFPVPADRRAGRGGA